MSNHFKNKTSLIEKYSDTLSKKDGIWTTAQTGGISYPDHWNRDIFLIEDQSYWFNHRNLVLCTIAQMFVPKGIVFDIGGGNGYVSKMLMENRYTPVLVEPGSEGILKARERGIEYLIHSRFEDAGFKDESIENAGLFDVIEHIEDDRSFLAALHRTLKADGRLILTVPAFQALWSKADSESGHYRRYNLNSIKKILHQTGFRVIYANYFFSFLTLPVLLFRSLPSLFSKREWIDEKTNKREHTPSSYIARKIISGFCHAELKRIQKGKRILPGSSCIVVAEKV